MRAKAMFHNFEEVPCGVTRSALVIEPNSNLFELPAVDISMRWRSARRGLHLSSPGSLVSCWGIGSCQSLEIFGVDHVRSHAVNSACY